MIPNIITTFRLLLVPLFAYTVLVLNNLYAACAIFVVSGISDIADGIIARKFNMITESGKVYDPLVDKLMQITALAVFGICGFIPLWAIVIIVLKEVIMIAVSLILYLHKIVVHSRWYGKASTVIFYTVILVLVCFGEKNLGIWETVLPIILVVSMLFSALAYIYQLKDFIKKKA